MNIDINPALIWFLAGLALILVEVVVPGIILVFFGVGAWIVALTTWWGWTDSLAWQLGVFAVTSIILLVTLRRTVRKKFFGHTARKTDGGIDMDNDDIVGRIVTVTKDIAPNSSDGRVEFKGAGWKAVSEDTLSAGSSAEIISTEGIVLHVRKIEGEA